MLATAKRASADMKRRPGPRHSTARSFATVLRLRTPTGRAGEGGRGRGQCVSGVGVRLPCPTRRVASLRGPIIAPGPHHGSLPLTDVEDNVLAAHAEARLADELNEARLGDLAAGQGWGSGASVTLGLSRSCLPPPLLPAATCGP